MKWMLSFLLLILTHCCLAQQKPFRFAFISDTHIGSPNGGAEEDLRRTVADINSMSDIAFVVITGDITELGTDREIQVAKRILDSLNKPYYIIPGNHDTGWSESGGLTFSSVFGDDKFHFQYGGIHFLGCASGPYVRMSDGHIPRSNMLWIEKELKKIGKNEPVVFLNHYPLDNGLDNWYQMIDLLKKKNTVLALCGHGHSNRGVNAEDIPAVMGRSNLRAKAPEGGYNLVDVRTDSFYFTERKPLSKSNKTWRTVAFQQQVYDGKKTYPRPDYSINSKYPFKAAWTYSSSANVISTPGLLQTSKKNLVVFGNQDGLVEALDLKNGKRVWRYKTKGPIFSSPATAPNRIVFGSADSTVYCLDSEGKEVWTFKAGASVLGSPVISGDTVFIGSSDHQFRALELGSGKPIWSFEGLNGPVTSTPTLYGNKIIFGAWDRNLYALDRASGALLWKWNNGSSVINFSPAACIPVVHEGVVYVVAPDRYLSAIDAEGGQTLWRSNESTVRESIGISADGKMLYGKTMNDTLVAFKSSREKAPAAWKMHVGYGYEHAPSMLIEKDGMLYFGTRSGVVYAIDPKTQQITGAYKIDNSMVNTVLPLGTTGVVASTMDGKVCRITF